MATEKEATVQQENRDAAETLWLRYFTQYLFQNNMLSEQERNRMLLKIENRKGSTAYKNKK